LDSRFLLKCVTHGAIAHDSNESAPGEATEGEFAGGNPASPFLPGRGLGLDNPTVEYGLLSDGFETGDTSRWSATVP